MLERCVAEVKGKRARLEVVPGGMEHGLSGKMMIGRTMRRREEALRGECLGAFEMVISAILFRSFTAGKTNHECISFQSPRTKKNESKTQKSMQLIGNNERKRKHEGDDGKVSRRVRDNT
jgi:hypothetical protein